MLVFYYPKTRVSGSIVLLMLFLSLIMRLMFLHKKVNSKIEKSNKKYYGMKKMYTILSLLGIFLFALFLNPNYSYTALIISVLSLAFLILTEYKLNESSRLKHYLIVYLVLVWLVKFLFEKEFILDKSKYYVYVFIVGVISLIGIYKAIRFNFVFNKKDKGFKYSNLNEERKDEGLGEYASKKFKNKTDVDHLYEYLMQEKNVKLSKVAQSFNVPKEIAEEWCRILEEGGLAVMHYPAVGEPELRWKSIK
jgi:hypothetical protein